MQDAWLRDLRSLPGRGNISSAEYKKVIGTHTASWSVDITSFFSGSKVAGK
jgi:hypothetical protein